jgi:hypothetical protein
MTSTTTRPASDPDATHAPARIDLLAHEAGLPLCPEELDRVTATAADLVVQGRRVTERALASLTGLEPATVEAAVHRLVAAGLLRPAGAAPHHYVFPPGRWPVSHSA